MPLPESTHNEPTPRKRRRKRDDPQSCFLNSEEYDESDDCSPMSCSDVESFQGKIVYNADGSAYIIDSENESLSNISENCMSVGTTITTNNPKIHSFRVVTARDASIHISEPNKIQKPILMCFICKLSFGNTKSFSLHANSEHTLNLQESEKLLLNREYSSAIIQRNVDEKPQISFLEPLDIQKQHQLTKQSTQTQQKQQEQPDQQQQIIGSTSSLSVTGGNNCNSSINCSTSPAIPAVTSCSSTLSLTVSAPSSISSTPSSIAPVSSAAAVAAAAAANAALVAAIAASCSNTSNNNNSASTSSAPITMNTSHLDSDLMMASLGAATTGTSSNPGYSNNPSSSNSSANCSQPNHQQHRSDNFENLNTLDLSVATAAAQAAAAAAATSGTTDVRNTPPPASPMSVTSSSPSSSSSSSPSTSISSSSAQHQQLTVTTTATQSGISKHTSHHSLTTSEPVPVSTSSTALSSLSSSSMNIIPLTKSTSSNSSGSSNVNNTSSNKNPMSALSPPTPTTVADFLQQQFQQMQNQMRITSPAPSTSAVSTSAGNTDTNAMASSAQTTNATSLSSLTASLAAAAAAVGTSTAGDLSTNTSNSVKLINDFLQHQLQQQQQHASSSSYATCPEHPDMKGIDCKSCELVEINMKSPMTPTRSPNSINLFSSNSTMSPTAAAAPSFTIGACPEHINGRPLGVDCSRCEMILNSARLNSGVQMSTRNSCKTLKCPQCNWHYKYQETLEIHMREKHPDGESACGYCLAGQQHPRLARGESYTCGYKPYRCEICNYSTTTKGNLSIHMQSDKHLNNMQELNSSQNMASSGAEIRESPKIIMPNMQQQTSKPKPSFRCDVCSYETSVARNLRIHMTSEKHTHNMAVLQNNIKHIQAFSFLQSQNLGQLTAAQSAAVAASNISNIPNLQNFLPEAALADIAYNQALMIQLIHQNSAAGALSAAAAAAAAANPLNLPQQSPAGSGAGTIVQSPSSVASTSSQQPPQQSYVTSQPSKLNQPQQPPPSAPTQVLSAAVASSSMTSSLPSSSTTSSSQHQQQSAVAAAALLAEAAAAAAAAATSADSATCIQQQQHQQQQQQQQQQQDSSLDPPIDPDPKPTTAFSCLICANYNTNSIDELNNHLMIDRSRNTNNNCSDVMMIINNNYICRLCNYKTNLKANFQLHSKTDKHLQKLNYINHIREGGIKNEYKLKYNQANTVQLKCNCCDFYTNSIQKLNLHTQHMRHDTMKMIFNHLLYLVNNFNASLAAGNCDSSIGGSGNSSGGAGVTENTESQLMSKNKVLTCQLCNFNAINILQMVQHVKSLRHIQVEQFICLQRRSENLESLGLDDVFKIANNTDCIKSERSSPDQSLESHQMRLKQDSEKNTQMLAKNIVKVSGERRDSYSESSDHQQHNIAASPLLSGASATGTTSSTNNKDLADVDLSTLPSIIYKCNNCDFFAQIKSEMEHHIANLHPNASEQDYLTIPTNPAALQAFHAAVTAAAAAANAAASQQHASRSKSSSPVHLQINQQMNEQTTFGASVCRNDMLTEVKTERMDTIDDDGQSNDECEQFDDPVESSSNLRSSAPSSSVNASIMCPLCQDTFNEKKSLEVHLMGVHSVNSDGLARLLQLVDNTGWLNTSRRSSASTTPEPRNSSTPHSDVGQSQPQQQQHQQLQQHQQPQQQQQQQQQQPCSSSSSSAGHQYACASEEHACPQCGVIFKLQQHLLMHANDMQHYQMVNEQYQCLAKHCSQLFCSLLQMLSHYKDTHMNIVISERHVYKYRCKQCSLAFKTQEKLNTHSLYHTMRDATKCMICNRNFRSTQSLQKHMEQAHNQMQTTGSPIPSPNSSGELTNASTSVSATPAISRDDDTSIGAQVPSLSTAPTTGTANPFSNQVLQEIYDKNDDNDNDDVGDEQNVVSTQDIPSDKPSPIPVPPPLPPPLPPSLIVSEASNIPYSIPHQLDDYFNSQPITDDHAVDIDSKLSCFKCKVSYSNQGYLAKHYKSNQHRRNEKLSIYPLEKYLDPNRPFKCEICRESFTQKNILLVHYNSVSHLHKAKKKQISDGSSITISSAVSDSSDAIDETKGHTTESSGGSGSRAHCGGAGGVATVGKLLHSKRKSTSDSTIYDSPKKRFKCDICKVAYAQGSTLDIHMRSVLHQTRASRLHDQTQQRSPMTPPSSSESPTSTVTSTTPTFNDQLYKSLLETYGFDIVKQFNEINKVCPANESEKFYCHYCGKVFSSVFVLKTHCEDIHNEKIPVELLEKFAEKFKNFYLEQQSLSSPSSLSLLFFNHSHNSNQNPEANFEINLGATSTACSESNSPSPMPDSAVGDGDNSSILPLTSQPIPATSPNSATVSAVATALLKQQQQQQAGLTPDLVQKLNLDPTMLAQKIMEQNFANFPPNFPGLPQNFQNLQSLQNLQNLQNMQQNLPNMSNLPMNTLDMLNLMQFHHLMSLNFMNLAPPLIFGAGGAGPTPSVAGSSSSTVAELPPTPATQIIQQQTASTSQNTSSQKRARTRITDDQLKILRAHFDINNSPSEESIMEMSKKANLPMKVVKHWFRNTLFKERQRNKDSPYNFNNPPSTTLNLEEYERTGQAKVTPLSESGGGGSSGFHLQQQQQQREHHQQQQRERERDQQQQIQTQQLQHQQQQRPPSSQSSDLNFSQLSFHHHHQQQQQHHDFSRQQQHHQQQQQQDNRPLSHPSSVTSDRGEIHIKSEPTDDIGSSDCDQHMLANKDQDNEQSMTQSHHQQSMFYNNFETKSESGSSEILSRPQTPNSSSTPYSGNISDILGQQIDNLPLNNMANISNLNNMGPPKKFQLNKMFEKSNNFETNSNSSNSSTSSGKRANRTRFTDYQIKVLQEFFENNSYPKDSDLEYLSKLLLLSPRVIVVWFQNARQKQRKIYENQPNNTFYESEEKKQNINYACKKCNLVFQRYYELIRHQKNHCFKEENNKKSAKAQIAAAQVAQSLSSEDSNSSIDINNANILTSNLAGQQAAAAAAAVAVAAAVGGTAGAATVPPVIPCLSTSPGINLLASPQHIFKQQQSVVGSAAGSHGDSTSPLQKFECDKCHLTFSRYELFKEHQLIHIMNPNLFMNQNYSESSPFGILQNLQSSNNNQQDTSIDLSRQKKRKYSETQSSADDLQQQQQQHNDYETFNKKFKHDQYDFLYQYFMQNETSADLRKQFQQQQQQQPELDLEYLANFYQQNELKKRSNYDFLFQYYLRNESKQSSGAASLMLLNDDANKPNMDFLLQYYQLSESKKFFQLEASPQRIHDFPPLLNLTSAAAAAAAAAISNNGSTVTQQQQQEVSPGVPTSVDIPMNTTNTNVNINTAISTSISSSSNCTLTPSTSPALAINNSNSSSSNNNSNTGGGIGTKDNNNSGQSQIALPMSLAAGAKLLTAATAACAGSGVQTTVTIPTTPINASTITGSNSFINNNRNGQMFTHHQKQQENSSLISNCLDASPVVAAAVAATASDLAVQSLKLSINNLSVNSVSKTVSSPLINNNNSIDLDTDTEMTATHHHNQQQLQHDLTTTSAPLPLNVAASHHHPTEETITTTEKQNSKRLRTTILPEQLNFLYECYQNESNPSRKMLEEISKKVNLKKRVVQVWYQNSRARERKGQFRQNIQIINKKCPHCAAIFKIKSALEWHLQSKHGDKQTISVDQIPDLKFADGLLNLTCATSGTISTFGAKHDIDATDQQQQQPQQLQQHQLPTLLKSSPTTSPSVALTATTVSGSTSSIVTPIATAATILALVKNGGSPLDLSKAQLPKYEQSESEISFSDSNNDHDESNDLFTPSSSSLTTNNRILNGSGIQQRQCDSNTLDAGYNDHLTASNGNMCGDYYGNERDNTNSPVSQTSSNHSGQQKKRFRTQMTNLQVRILKTLFKDVKTPSMTDCSNIGREIGLQKRVIQVWFQNARAKEKKSRNQRYIHDESTYDNDAVSIKSNVDSTTSIPEIRNCNICKLSSVNIQEHVFSPQHIGQVRMLLESNGSKNNDDQHQTNNSIDYEINGIYSQLYGQHKNTTTDIERADTSHHDEDYADADADVDADGDADADADIDNHCSVNNDVADAHTEDEDDMSLAQTQTEDLALNEINKAALALKNFNKLQQHFAAATALAKQQQQHQQQEQHQSQCDTVSSASPPAMENNLMLKINTDNPLSTNHSEMLQQLFNYSQMSVIGGK